MSENKGCHGEMDIAQEIWIHGQWIHRKMDCKPAGSSKD